MNLKDYSAIYWGKEYKDVKSNSEERTDIIHRIYLGDRQIWEKGEPTELTDIESSNKIIMTWNINNNDKKICLANLTGTTTIIGVIDWGDGTEDYWESGNSYLHEYGHQGKYDIAIIANEIYEEAEIGQIRDKIGGNTLEKIVFGEIKFSDHILSTTIGWASATEYGVLAQDINNHYWWEGLELIFPKNLETPVPLNILNGNGYSVIYDKPFPTSHSKVETVTVDSIEVSNT